jgi:hypothetical protein
MNCDLHILIALEFRDLQCFSVAHINGSMVVQGQDCKADGPEVAGRLSLLMSTRPSSNCLHHLLTCSDLVITKLLYQVVNFIG